MKDLKFIIKGLFEFLKYYALVVFGSDLIGNLTLGRRPSMSEIYGQFPIAVAGAGVLGLVLLVGCYEIGKSLSVTKRKKRK